MATTIPHIVLTRLGIGVCRKEFFDTHIEYMRRASAMSLARQSEDSLTWVVATDILAPEGLEEQIEGLGVPRTHVWRIDPVSAGLDPLSLTRLRHIVPAGEVIITRLDDDDLLHPEFAKETRETFTRAGSLAAHTFPSGVNLFSDGRVQHQAYPWIGLGLSIKSTIDNIVSPYRVKHTLIPKVMSDLGGEALTSNTDDPRWIRSIHADSDSDFRWRARRATVQSETADLSAFGLQGEALSKLCEALDAPIPYTPAVLPDQPIVYSRLELKGRILAELRKAVRESPGDQRIFALRQAFYSL